jgi:hypothetical protein
MGFMSKGLVKAYANQKKGILKEAEKAGCQVVSFSQQPEDGPPEGAAGRAVANLAKSLFGGNLETDAIQVVACETGGLRHVFVQPYAGMTPLPGEHHAVLPGSVAAPAILQRGGLLSGVKWRSEGEEVARSFQGNGALKKVVKKCKWDWYVGSAKITLDWALQVRSLGDGRVHLAFQNGRYGGFTTYGVGFAQLLAVAGALGAVLGGPPAPEQPFSRPPAFAGLALALLLGVGP